MLRYISLIILFLFVLTPNVEASHISGANLTYKCLGNNQYLISFKYYRDCFGIPPHSMDRLYVTSSCSNDTMYLITYDNIREVSQVCPDEKKNTTCNHGHITGMQEVTYSDTIALDTTCADWVFSWDICCRNRTNNVYQSEISSAHITTGVNNAIRCNNSPTINAIPIPYVCVGDTVRHNVGAIDLEGDHLKYSLISVLGGQFGTSQKLKYNSGYTYDIPIPNFEFDSTNGDIEFVADKIGNYIVVVRIDEYDKSTGKHLGYITRDFEFVVRVCENKPPYMDDTGVYDLTNGIKNDTTTVTLCYKQNGCFKIKFKDDDTNDKLTLTSDISKIFPGATFTTTGQNPLTAEFCVSNIRWPNVFNITIKDDHCPYFSFSSYSVKIIPNFYNIKTLDVVDIDCYKNCTGSIEVKDTSNAKYIWSNGETGLKIDSLCDGIYFVNSVNYLGCKDTRVVELKQPDSLEIKISDDMEICIGDTVGIYQAAKGGAGGYKFYWNNQQGNQYKEVGPRISQAYVGAVRDKNNCVAYDVLDIIVNPLPVAEFTADPNSTDFYNTVIQFDNTSIGSDTLYWDFSGLGQSNEQSPSFDFKDAGKYPVKLKVISKHNCVDSVIHIIQINEEFKVYIPNAFTPDDDGVNDVFQPVIKGTSGYDMEIFDRWGEMIYKTDSFWDGRVIGSNRIAPEGVYVYRISVTDSISNDSKIYVGHVTLLDKKSYSEVINNFIEEIELKRVLQGSYLFKGVDILEILRSKEPILIKE